MSAAFMESAMLDISPEDQLDMARKKKITHWDEKKRKFVKQTMAEMAEAGKKGIKRLRSESGIGSKTGSKTMGELYEKWKKKSRT
jgi:CO dehydrogenase/acetyl-CoA synthase alpha subunit